MNVERGLLVNQNIGTATKHDRRHLIVSWSKRRHDSASASRIGASRCWHIVEGLFISSLIVH